MSWGGVAASADDECYTFWAFLLAWLVPFMPLARILSGEPFSRRSPPEARGYANQVESIVSLRPERTLLPRVSKSPSESLNILSAPYETTGEWFFKKPRGRAPLGATSWDASTGEWVGEQQPPSAYRAGKRAGKPAAAAPAPKKRKKSQARHAFAVGERVEAHWQKKWWPAVVHGLEDDGSYEVHWEGDGRYDYVAAGAVRAVPSGSSGFLGRIFGK